MKHEVESYEGELKSLRQENEKMRTMILHGVAERTGVYFICGEAGSKDSLGLPEKILVCPAYGSDGFAIYTKSKEYGQPEY